MYRVWIFKERPTQREHTYYGTVVCDTWRDYIKNYITNYGTVVCDMWRDYIKNYITNHALFLAGTGCALPPQMAILFC